MPFVSYSQNQEDVLLWRVLQAVESGFYIDVGAADPEELSVTQAFYERGWSGINIEPMREHFERLQAMRPRDANICAVLGAAPGLTQLHAIPGTGLSTVQEEVARAHGEAGWDVHEEPVTQLTLTSLMETRGDAPIHFLKIDVEGAEKAVLEGADLRRFRPWIVVMEATAPLSPDDTRHEWEDLLCGQGYRFAIFDGLNCFYVADEHADLIERLAVPANVFDDYMRIGEVNTAASLAKARQELQAMQQLHATLGEQNASLVGQHAALAEQNSVQTSQYAALAEQHTTLAGQHAELGEQHAVLGEQHAMLAEQHAALAAQNAELVEQQVTLSGQQAAVAKALEQQRAVATALRTLLADNGVRMQAAEEARQAVHTNLTSLRSAHADLRSAHADLRGVHAELHMTQFDLQSRYELLREAAALLDYRLQATLMSHSWRMTGAVRAASRLVRRALGRPVGQMSDSASYDLALHAGSSRAGMAHAGAAGHAAADAGPSRRDPQLLSRSAALVLRRLEIRGALQETI